MPEYLVARSFFKVAGLGGTSSPYQHPSFIRCDVLSIMKSLISGVLQKITKLNKSKINSESHQYS